MATLISASLLGILCSENPQQVKHTPKGVFGFEQIQNKLPNKTTKSSKHTNNKNLKGYGYP